MLHADASARKAQRHRLCYGCSHGAICRRHNIRECHWHHFCHTAPPLVEVWAPMLVNNCSSFTSKGLLWSGDQFDAWLPSTFCITWKAAHVALHIAHGNCQTDSFTRMRVYRKFMLVCKQDLVIGQARSVWCVWSVKFCVTRHVCTQSRYWSN